MKADDLQISLPIRKDLGQDGYRNVIIYFKPNNAKQRQELFKAKYSLGIRMERKSPVDRLTREKFQKNMK